MSEVKKGVYEHYKGGQYQVLEEALHSETKEPLVVYQDLKKPDKIWVRPKEMFISLVTQGEKEEPRFKLVSEENPESFEHKYLRALADYQNLLKQTAKEREEFVKYALEDFLQGLLPVYDHLKLALSGLSSEEANNPWAQGVGHVLKQFKELLNQSGVEEIKTVGEKFNHELMDAVDGQGEIVKQELMPGYRLRGKVIRAAKVIVSE